MSQDTSRTFPVSVSESSQKAAIESLISISRLQVEAPPLVLPNLPVPTVRPVPEIIKIKRASEPRYRRMRVQPGSLALLLVLAGQIYLTLPLIWSNTAFQDEALYLWAGRLEWMHWIHGTPIPDLPSYFSGAPVFYPPLAAAADAVGGLAAARMLSLAFMLGATSLLWAVTTRLYGRRAAFFACGAWVVLGPTQRLGAFATFDAMSLFLLALAAWCIVRAGSQRDAAKWMLAAASAALLANIAKYASVIFDPVIIALAGFAACPKPGGKVAAARWAAVLTYIVAGAVALILIAGHDYSSGINATTLARASGQQDPAEVLTLSWQWIGVIIVLGACGVGLTLFNITSQRHQAFLLGLMAGAALLVPLEQARIHSTTSLDKHVDFGAWFAAVAGGYAVDRILSFLRSESARALMAGALTIILVPIAAVGATQARQFFAWPNATAFLRAFRPLAEHSSGPMLVETSSVAEYYLPGISWQRWSSTFSITTPAGQSVAYDTHNITGNGEPSVYHQYISDNYFDLIALNYSAGGFSLDGMITKWLRNDPEYRIAASVPYGSGYYTIWRRISPSAEHRHRLHRHRLHRHRQPRLHYGER
jgi:hypothetical protein